jgi:hypothetical protein
MKLKSILFFISVIASISFIACNKNNSSEQLTSVDGIVVKFPTRQVMPGVKVYLVRQSPLTSLAWDPDTYWTLNFLDTLIWPPKYRIDSTFADANGRFSFVYDSTNCNGYPCGGIFYTTVLDPAYVIAPYVNLDPNTDTIYVDQPSYFKLNMHKITPATINDTLFESNVFIYGNNLSLRPIFFRKAQVGKTDVTIIDTFSYNAYSKVRLEWRHYKNGIMSSGIDTISLIQNGTKVYDVFY